MEKILSIKNLRKNFGPVVAVDDISFDVEAGELFAFLGINGAGKSTTINILVGILKKDGGTVVLDGHPIEEIDRILPEVGIVFQNSVLDRRLTVLDNLRYRALLYKKGKADFERTLSDLSRALELSDILRKPLWTLSGGQRRKADIARALLPRPKLLILDEPTTGLDPKTRKELWDLLEQKRRKEGLTILLTTHYMEEAAIADHVVLMDHGRIVARGTPVSLKERYAKDVLRVYRWAEPLLEALSAEGRTYTRRGEVLDIPFDDTASAKAFLMRHGETILDLEIVKGTMDDVFLAATGKELERL